VIMSNFSAVVVRVVAALALCIATWQVTPAVAQSDQSINFTIGQGVRNKPQSVQAPVKAYAGYYAPYAIQAVAAYRSVAGLNATLGQPPQGGYGADVQYAIASASETSDSHNFGVPATTELARKLFRSWHYQFGHEGYLECLDNDPQCEQALPSSWWKIGANSLAFQVWANMRARHNARSSCSEVSLAFRGTDFYSFSDWASNFHQVIGFGTDDAYDTLARNIDTILKKIRDLHCYGSGTQIVSVGHSLGGGLAQFAALAHSRNVPRIVKVFAFDSSPVTATNRLDQAIVQANAQGLTVDRIHQKGEVLTSYIGWDQQFPSSSSRCNPIVRTVEFDTYGPSPVGGPIQRLENAVARHDSAPLAQKLVQWSNPNQESYPPLPGTSPTNCPTDYRQPGPKVHIGIPVARLGTGQTVYASNGPVHVRQYAGTYGTYMYATPQYRIVARTVRLKAHRFATAPATRKKITNS
jgi:pimeloyl-ACP methyl ester carboxylesterase